MKTQIALLILGALALSACGGGTKTAHQVSDQTSLETPDDNVNNGKAFTYCNHTSSHHSEFKLALHSYVESGDPRNDLMYGMLTKLPSDFKTSKEIIRFFRWKVDSNGKAVLDSNPISFRITNPSLGEDILSSRTSFSWSDVAESAAALHASNPKDFFRRAFFILNLKDSEAEYQGLMMVAYNKAGAEQDRVTTLLPLFNVDPNGYMTPSAGVTRPTVLTNLHPYRLDLGENLSLALNKERIQELCAPWNEGL